MTSPAMTRSIRILHLEDSAADAELIQSQLRRGGLAFTIERVETRDAFVRALGVLRPDIVISDFQLPGFNGREALQIVRRGWPDLPVVMVTGALADDEAVGLIKAGATDVVLKDRLARLAPAVTHALAEAEEIRARRAAESAMRRGRVQAEAERRRHEEAIRVSLEESMQAMANAIEMRDPYTAGHQGRVACLSGDIARALGFDADRVRGLELAASIHDLGKIAVPSGILNKPGRLSPAEIALVRTHAQAGYEVLREVHFVWPVAEIVRQHHERLDGSGYPRGLKSGEILPETKVVVVADVVEAMAGPRPYRAALGIEAALAEIRQGRGTLYDSDAANACIALFREGRYFINAAGLIAPAAVSAAA